MLLSIRGLAGIRDFSVTHIRGTTAVEKRIRSSQIVILTAVSSLLLAMVITTPVVFVGAECRNDDPAAEASLIAEQHLERAMDELKRTGACSSEGRMLKHDEGGAGYELDTRVVRDGTGLASRISVRVRWDGPLGGGAVVATGICGCGESGQSGSLKKLADLEQ